MIGVFLALLELIRQKKILVQQGAELNDLSIDPARRNIAPHIRRMLRTALPRVLNARPSVGRRRPLPPPAKRGPAPKS